MILTKPAFVRNRLWCSITLLIIANFTVACSSSNRPASTLITPVEPAPLASKLAKNGNDSAAATTVAIDEPAPEANVTKLMTDDKKSFLPMNCVQIAPGKLAFLGGDCLYLAKNTLPDHTTGGTIYAQKINKPAWGKSPGLSIPVHEFANLTFAPTRNSIIVLDKSGDLFEYSLSRKVWSVLRANVPISGSPDPEFIDFCLTEGNHTLNLLDPERNQIWRLNLTDNKTKLVPTFTEVMPWRVKPGDTSVAECISITYDQRFYLLKQFGQLVTVEPKGNLRTSQSRLPLRPLSAIGQVRPSRMISADGSPLYIVERQNNRILAVDKASGKTRAFIFPNTSSLRGLLPTNDGFWAINNDVLEYRNLIDATPQPKLEKRQNDPRLSLLSAPLFGMKLPRHSGVYPGARRLYRYGVHEGLDLFNDRTHIAMNTPVIAAGAGKIVRADSNFVDMNRGTFNHVMSECVNEHRTSDANEDLLRGCQVWIDHGDNMITRYAHLNKINPKIRLGQSVKPGDLIGFVGVSGTGQNLPGRTKYPHLHFEIWLDGKYLGYGLTPAETVGIFEDIFESPSKTATRERK